MLTIDWLNHIFWLCCQLSVLFWVTLALQKNSRNTTSQRWYYASILVLLSVLWLPLCKWLFPPIALPVIPSDLYDQRLSHIVMVDAEGWVYQPLFLGLVMLYAVVLCFKLMRIFDRLLGAVALKDDAVAVDNTMYQHFVAPVARSVGVFGRVRCLVSERITSPVTMGVIEPVILLPSDYTQWPEATQKRILMHELTHVRRMDWLLMVVLELIATFFWFVPGIHKLLQQVAWYAELSCDDQVLQLDGDRPGYAEDMLLIAGARTQQTAFVLSLIESSSVYDRIQWVLDGARHRESTRFGNYVLSFFCLVLLVPYALLKLGEAPDAQTHVAFLEHQSAIDPTAIVGLNAKQSDDIPLPLFDGQKFDTPAKPQKTKFLSSSVPSVRVIGMLDIPHAETVVAIEKPHIALEQLFVRTLPNRALPERSFTPDIVYPKRALAQGKQGKIQLMFDVDHQGHTTNIRLLNQGEHSRLLENAALKAVNLFKYQVAPDVRSEILYSDLKEVIEFKLSEDASGDKN